MNDDNYYFKFSSVSQDNGIKALENYYCRTFENIQKHEIMIALMSIAAKGDPKDPGKDKLVYIKSLLEGELMFHTNSNDRKNLYIEAIKSQTPAKRVTEISAKNNKEE